MRKNVFVVIVVFLWNLEFIRSWITPPTLAPRADTILTTRHAKTERPRSNYEETLADEPLRHFWESQTFDEVETILDAVIHRNESFVGAPLLVRCTTEEKKPSDNSPCIQGLFSPLFQELPEPMSDDTLTVPTGTRPRQRRSNFRLIIAYRGSDFCGFQTQHQNVLASVQQSLEVWLQTLSTNNTVTPTRVNIRVSGRTDAGVSAVGQVCRFRTKQNVTANQVLLHVNACPLAKRGSLKCLEVNREPDSFHPTFGCSRRGYVYVLNPRDITTQEVNRLNAMLQRLEGQELDYVAMSYGRVKTETTLCTLEYCRASLCTLSVRNECVLCLKFVGNRFLRRMVRILVATALRQVLMDEDSDSNSLLRLIQSRDRKQCARPAPPFSLIFVGAQVD